MPTVLKQLHSNLPIFEFVGSTLVYISIYAFVYRLKCSKAISGWDLGWKNNVLIIGDGCWILISFLVQDFLQCVLSRIAYNLSCPGLPAKRNEVVYECCPEPYLDITFTINIRFVGLFDCNICLSVCLFFCEPCTTSEVLQ